MCVCVCGCVCVCVVCVCRCGCRCVCVAYSLGAIACSSLHVGLTGLSDFTGEGLSDLCTRFSFPFRQNIVKGVAPSAIANRERLSPVHLRRTPSP